MGHRTRGLHGSSRRKRGTVRASALCAQVRRALEWALFELCDERLDGIQIEEVLPHPNVSRMLVVLRTHELDRHQIEQIRDALERSRGLLRSQVAAAIHRKRTPHLVFAVLDHDAVPALELEEASS